MRRLRVKVTTKQLSEETGLPPMTIQNHGRDLNKILSDEEAVLLNVTKIDLQRARTSSSCSLWYEGKAKKAAEITLARKGRILQGTRHPSQRPRLGKPPKDPAIRKQELHLEWLESREGGDIERRFGIGKRCYSLRRITAKLKHTSEIMIHMSVLTLNLQKRLRLLLRFIFASFRRLRVA